MSTKKPASRISIPLNSWCFKAIDAPNAALLPTAGFPTNIHLDLLHHGLIPDPFVGRREDEVQWVGEQSWTYRCVFSSPERPTEASRVALVFEGLDTFATVRLDGEVILEAKNMFLPERVDVTDRLKRSGDDGGTTNELEITFESAYLSGWQAVDKNPGHKWNYWNGDESRLAVRKAQYHWGWDWGPTLITCGPWRPVFLEVFISRIVDLWYDLTVNEDLTIAKITAHVTLEGPADSVKFELLGPDDSAMTIVMCAVSISAEPGLSSVSSTTIVIEAPRLWYPVRCGPQDLYTLRATICAPPPSDSPNGPTTVYDTVSKRIGLRRAELVQRPLADAPGTSFFFRINNIPIFCAGSNWIPADNFAPRISERSYREWVDLAANGNQNMIRVWGGGMYEDETFYNACDELGVLVWQDFMFGCGNYPADDEFLTLVEREARSNLTRLRHHPSIVVWAGNNEDYQLAESELKWDPADKDPQSWLKSEFPARYIYEKLLPDICAELIPATAYRPGSPWGGNTTRDPTVGDIHQWNVWHGSQEKYQDYDKLSGRFVSEFGMEAFPSTRTIDQFLPMGIADPDRYAQSATVDHHNKASGHERRLALYLAENVRFSAEPLEGYVYATQLVQAEAVSTAFRLWRRQWKGDGREGCAGSLVWQLNDCWPCTSWAVCDYYKRPKLAWWAIKREMAPVTVGMVRRETGVRPPGGPPHTRVGIETTTSLEVWGSNLTFSTIAADCVLRIYDVETGDFLREETVAKGVTLGANRSTEFATVNISCLGLGHDAARTVVVAYLRQSGKTTQLARHVNWPEPLKHVKVARPRGLEAKISADKAAVEVRVEVPVKAMMLNLIAVDEKKSAESEDSRIPTGKAVEVEWDDNGADLVPGEVMRFGVKGPKEGMVLGMSYYGMFR